MRMKNRTGPVRTAAAVLLFLSATLSTPSVLLAQTEKPATLYEACMDKAEASLLNCIEKAGELEYLCWSKYGYDKLGCTISYGIRIIIRT